MCSGGKAIMHEMSLAENMLQIIEGAAREQNFRRVRCVTLEVGRLAAVEPDAMHFCFDAVTAGSIAEGARLEIVETAGQGRCRKCTRDFPLAALYEACPECESYDVEVTGGDGMRVKELEVE